MLLMKMFKMKFPSLLKKFIKTIDGKNKNSCIDFLECLFKTIFESELLEEAARALPEPPPHIPFHCACISQPLLHQWITGWKEKQLNGSKREIDRMTHHILSGCSTTELYPAPFFHNMSLLSSRVKYLLETKITFLFTKLNIK